MITTELRITGGPMDPLLTGYKGGVTDVIYPPTQTTTDAVEEKRGTGYFDNTVEVLVLV